jgi:hypothetical protein
LPGEICGPALQPFPGDPQRVEAQFDRARVTFAVGFEPVGLSVVAIAVEFDDQPVILVEGVYLVAVPERLELWDREIEGDQKRFELVLEDAAARRLLGVLDLGGARTELV